MGQPLGGSKGLPAGEAAEVRILYFQQLFEYFHDCLNNWCYPPVHQPLFS